MDENRFYGDEDQNEKMAEIDAYKEEQPMFDREKRIKELDQEITAYKEAISDAMDALASAEMELDAVLDELPY